ncbi:ATP-binding cassette domain-containing protein [Microbacterium sp.]|uniref:ATP-binding cassette domain-containing protein n=1 Tax=Microbacterium sp. TaxID=51671 RepID=UPI0025ECC582|nr:ATP-binding cassette domain-containing protein [Microbacterium sp.]
MPRIADDAPAIRAADLSLDRGGVRVIDGMTFTLQRGGALAIMGPTGAGKSSLAAILSGVRHDGLTVAGGDAWVTGISVRRGGRRLRVRGVLTGYLAQGAGSSLPSRLTVEDVISEPIMARDRSVNPRGLAIRVAGLLDELELPLGAAAKYPYELSSGMRQRVALARALILEPLVFIGDDPYANLDIGVRRAARDALLRRREHAGMALLVVTNDSETVRELQADVVVLRAGHIVGCGRGGGELVWTPDGRNALAL